MAIPSYQDAMIQVLRALSDGEVHSRAQVVGSVADAFGVTEEERKLLLPSGKGTVINNRVGWAKAYLKQARLLDSPRRGQHRITERGQEVLSRAPKRIDVKLLIQFPEFREFMERSRRQLGAEPTGSTEHAPLEAGEATPEETLDQAYLRLRGETEVELLELAKSASPGFFEKLVVELIVAMGYGGSHREAAQVLGGTGDGGVDGIVSEDRLGLDVVYLQAKRWQGTVGRPEIQKFAGALQGQRAKKGVFMTTGFFSREAEDYAAKIESRIVLIDGQRLASLMFDHDVGVAPQTTYQVKRIDSDYFAEE